MGGKTQKTTSTQTTKPPQYIEDAYKGLLSRAQGVADTPYSEATERQVAGFTAPQTQAFQNVQNIQGIQNPYIGQASDYANSGASTITADNIGQYLNPYQNQVIDSTLQQIGRNNAMQQGQLTGNAALKGALGGDRVGVAQAELARNQDMTTADILAQMNSQNYNQALSAAQADKSRQFQGAQMSAALGNQAQQAGYQDIGSLLGIGSVQQQQQQSEYDTATGNAQQQQQYPFNTTQWLAGITQGLGSTAGGTTNGVQTTPGPSALSQIAGLGLAGASLMSGFPGASTALGTTLSGMFGGSRNLSGLADGGMVDGDLNGDGTVDHIDDLIARAHKAAQGIGAIQKAVGGRTEPKGIGAPLDMKETSPGNWEASKGFAAGGFPDDDDDDVDLFKDPYGNDDDSLTANDALYGSLLHQESGNRNIQGPLVTRGANAGDRAQGPAQIMPKTAASPGYGVRPLDANAADPVGENRRFGRDYLNAMLREFGGDEEAALIAYNAGPANAQKWIAANRDYSVLPDRGQTEPYVRNIQGMAGSGGLGIASRPPAGLPEDNELTTGNILANMASPEDEAGQRVVSGLGMPSGAGTSQPSASSASSEDSGWSPNLPLLAAGLGILASKSPFPGVAIGEGGLKGVEALMTQRKTEAGAKKLAEAAKIAQQRLGIQVEAQKARQEQAQAAQDYRERALTERQRHNESMEKRAFKPVEVNGRLVAPDDSGAWKEVYESPPKPAGIMAGDRKEIYASDEAVRAGDQALGTLDKALDLNKTSFEGWAPETRAWVGSLFGNKASKDTRELRNVVTGLALEQLRLTFGGSPTEGERQILVELQGSLDEDDEVRERIFDRAKEAVQKRIQFNREQAQAIRSGEYFKPGYDPNAAVQKGPPTSGRSSPPPTTDTPAGAPSAPKPKAVEFLAANPTPEVIAQFDQKYGKGAAERVLQTLKQNATTTPFNPATDMMYSN